MYEYKEYCREAYDNKVIYFVPTNPHKIDDNWFYRTKEWYDKKETGQIQGQPISFHYWAVDGDKFIGEFQLRTEFTDDIMTKIGNIGYAVRVSQQSKGYGYEILKQGLEIAKEHGMDKIQANNDAEGIHILRRYWIYL